jgi:hypothetical protein
MVHKTKSKYYLLGVKGDDDIFVQGPLGSLKEANNIANVMTKRYNRVAITKYVKTVV